MADEAAVVGKGRAFWSAACSRCAWTYRGPSREVDMAARGHCRNCGGDVIALVIGKDRDSSPVVLRLERDVLGRVVPGFETTVLDARTMSDDTLRLAENRPVFDSD
jgi:hypothetical protein